MSKTRFLSSCCETWAGSQMASSGLQMPPVQSADPSTGPAKKNLCQFLHSHTPARELITAAWVPDALTANIPVKIMDFHISPGVLLHL